MQSRSQPAIRLEIAGVVDRECHCWGSLVKTKRLKQIPREITVGDILEYITSICHSAIIFRKNIYSSFHHFANISQRVADQGRAGGKIISTSEFACQGFLVACLRYLICELLEIFQFSSVQGISFVSIIRYL